MLFKKDYIQDKCLIDNDEDTSKLLEYLISGGTDRKTIRKLCLDDLKKIDERNDCSDYHCATFIRVLYSFENIIGKKIEELILNSLTNYPFFESNDNSMCTWSECHQLSFMASAFLLGQKYPETNMLNGQSGLSICQQSQERLSEWCEYIYRFGFSEFGNSLSYAEILVSLGNLIEFCEDDVLNNKFKIVLDLALFDIFSTTLPNYSYNKACFNNDCLNNTNYLAPYIRCLLGEKLESNQKREAIFNLMLLKKDENGKPIYQLPKVFKNIIRLKEREIKESNGVETYEAKSLGLLSNNDADTRYLLTLKAFFNDETIKPIVSYFETRKMWNNTQLQTLKLFKNIVLKHYDSYHFLKRILKLTVDDMAYGKGNVYTYVKNKYALSSLQKYHLGKGSYSQITNMVSLDGLTIFSNSFRTETNHWMGSFINPDVRQYKNTMMMMYKFDQRKGYGQYKSHVYFPLDQFDESDLSYMADGFAFGRYHGINIMIKSNEGITLNKNLSYIDNKETALTQYDIVNNHLGNHFYIINVNDELSFQDFINKMLDKRFVFNNDGLIFGKFNYMYDKNLFYNANIVKNEYHRFESKYVLNNHYDYDINKPLTLICGNAALTLDFKNYTRKQHTL